MIYPKFKSDNSFQQTLRTAVSNYFISNNKSEHATFSMYLKAVLLVSAFIVIYSLLVFTPSINVWQSLGLSIILGFIVSGIGFNIQHDGTHGAFSKYPIVNKIAAFALDIIGGSSFYWRKRHVFSHHTYVNIDNHDVDIDAGGLARITPSQKIKWFHRYQHIYIWFLYGFLALKWHLIDDFAVFIRGKVSGLIIERPKGAELFTFLLGKAIFITIALIIPLLFHPLLHVLFFYGIIAFLLGLIMGTIFQLAHCSESSDYQIQDLITNTMDDPWAIHQITNSADFSRDNKLLTFFLGGLNFQIEHHLFPKIAHVHYSEISKIVERKCKDYGIKYSYQMTLFKSIKHHYDWLKKMGRR